MSNPAITTGFFIGWLIYTIKSWNFVSGQLLQEHNQFLYYSINSFNALKRFKSWFYTQFIISLPFVAYTFLAMVVGVIMHYYAMVIIITGFTLALIAISALAYVKLVNRLIDAKQVSWLFKLSRSWGKPFFSLFIYHVFDKLKVTYALSKLLSYLVIISVFFALADVRTDLRVAGLTVLGVITAHAIIIYHQHKFEQTYLSVSRNFPCSIVNLYLYYILTYTILLLPECTWLLVSFKLLVALPLLALATSILILFHCLLYKIGLGMYKYLPWVFGLFFLISLVILFGYIWILIPLCFGGSFMLFYFNYYDAELEV